MVDVFFFYQNIENSMKNDNTDSAKERNYKCNNMHNSELK